MKRASLLVLIVGATSLAACDGLKEALTAHVDVVARAASQLSDMLGNAKIQIPINKDVATLVARDLWVPYQLLGTAGAHGDSLNDAKAIDAAASGMIEQAKLQKFMEGISTSMPSDTGSQAAYEAGANGLFARREGLHPAQGRVGARAGHRRELRRPREEVQRRQLEGAGR